MYLGLVLIVMIVTGSYILISMQNTEIDKARDQLELYAQKVSEQVVESYDEADFQTGLEQFTRTSSSDSQIQGNMNTARRWLPQPCPSRLSPATTIRSL